MAVLKRRTRIVSFRLSEDEYEQLQKTFVGKGAHSLSDFVRVALARLGNRDSDSTHERSELRALARRVKKLDSEVRRLTQMIDATPSDAAMEHAVGPELFPPPANLEAEAFEPVSQASAAAAAASSDN
jgi:Arc/MetJ-type ribon-helix-helix transcriptional regulator